MAGLSALTLEEPRLAASQPYEIKLFFSVSSGTVTQLLTRDLPPIIFGTTSGAFTQAAVNALLEKDSTGATLSAASTSEVNVAVAFGSTAMGTDAFGFVLACDAQIARVAGMEAFFYPGTEDAKYVTSVTSLPDTLTSGLLVTPAGNLAGRVIPGGLDSGTGQLVIKIYAWSK